jgi:hypothetical protein
MASTATASGLDASRHIKPKKALVVHVEAVGEGPLDDVGNAVVGGGVLVGSLQPPNQPGCWQLEVNVDVGSDGFVVKVGAGAGEGVLE